MLGLNKSVPATCFPTASLSACSFDPELLAEAGRTIAKEALSEDVAVLLGPGACLKKNPLCGRNFEYFSEDPYLAGKLAAGFISGAESEGVGTSLKHFACNNQETKRFSSDSILDERTLREMYLTAFEIAVKEGKPSTVMCSYNKINGVYSSDNKKLLTDILRNEWGFDGMVVTDWGAMHDRSAAFLAGCDLTMPGGSSYGEKEALRQVRSGRLPEEAVDKCAERVITAALHWDQIRKTGKKKYDPELHHEIARKAAEESMVLLKNEDEVLPLRAGEKIALIGYMAEYPRYQGAGSSHINPHKLTCLKEVMPYARYASGCDAKGDTTKELLEETARAAAEADKVIVVAGLTDEYESEGFDRETMKMPEGHIRMIETAAKANPNTIVVLCCGGVVETPWEPLAKAVLYAGLSGQAGAEAIERILTGKVNPGGRLAETWPLKYEDCPSSSYFGEDNKDGQYRESIYVGYRYYEKAGKTVRWPFGHGLSYTAFSYRDLKYRDGRVSVRVKNTGKYAGAEAVLLYIYPPQDGVFRPVRELKRFSKIYLEPGEEKEVVFELDSRCFAVWHDGWIVPKGTYGIQAGTERTEVFVEGEVLPVSDWQKESWYDCPDGCPTEQDWEPLIGFYYREKKPQKGSFTIENTVMEMKEQSLIMKLMYQAVRMVIVKGSGGNKNPDDADFKMKMAAAADCSMSSMQINSGMRDGIMQGLVEMANGHFLKGIIRMIKGE